MECPHGEGLALRCVIIDYHTFSLYSRYDQNTYTLIEAAHQFKAKFPILNPFFYE